MNKVCNLSVGSKTIQLIKNGDIRNCSLKEVSFEYNDYKQEIEISRFKTFLRTKNCLDSIINHK